MEVNTISVWLGEFREANEVSLNVSRAAVSTPRDELTKHPDQGCIAGSRDSAVQFLG